MRTGNNIRQRSDGRYEARYIKEHTDDGKTVWGYCYGKTYAEAEKKRNSICNPRLREMNLLILGSGDHGEEVYELAYNLRVFNKMSFLDDYVNNDNIIGKCERFEDYINEYPIAIPAVGNTELRIKWMNELSRKGFVIPTLIHPTAIVSNTATIGIGSVICARATIGPGVEIGKGSIISSGATIDKNVKLSDWSYVECGQTISTKMTL